METVIKKLVPRKVKRWSKRLLNNAHDSFRYFEPRQGKPHQNCRHVVFVCKGNICRSPFAEYFLRKRYPNNFFKIESCGVDVDQGGFSPPEAVQAASIFDVNLKDHRSKGLKECDLEGADLILTMEYWQYRRLVVLFPEKAENIFMLREFAPWPDRLFCNIYDPYGQEPEEFESCFRLMEKALDGFGRQICDNNRNRYAKSV